MFNKAIEAAKADGTMTRLSVSSGSASTHRREPSAGEAAQAAVGLPMMAGRRPWRCRALELLSFGDQGWGDEMLRGALMTLAVSLSSMALGLVFGTLGAAAKLSGVAPARWLAEGYTTIVRGIPELLVIYLLFFGGSGAVMFVARIFGYGGYIELNAFTIGTFAVGVVSGAYSTEVIRGAVLSVPAGQIEAAQAIGMRRSLLFRRIMLPRSRASRCRGSATSGS